MERLLVVPDTHSPYHDERAWRLMLKAARQFKPHTIIHMGDLADFYAISAHSKSPERAAQLKEELKVVNRLRASLERLGAKRLVFIEGNHEDRLRRYIEQKAPELFGLFDTPSLLGLEKWEFIPYTRHAKIGKVYFTHDVGGGTAKYTTARALEAYQHSVGIGHHHRIQYQVEGDATGKYRVGVQFGWLGDTKKADYMQQIKIRRNWALGFGVGYKDADGVIHFEPCPIVNYSTCVSGRLVRG